MIHEPWFSLLCIGATFLIGGFMTLGVIEILEYLERHRKGQQIAPNAQPLKVSDKAGTPKPRPRG